MKNAERIDRRALKNVVLRSSYLQREAVRLAPEGGREQRMARQSLLQANSFGAYWLAAAGDRRTATLLYREVISRSKAHPETGGIWRETAERKLMELRRGKPDR